jgi:hypothetical protein
VIVKDKIEIGKKRVVDEDKKQRFEIMLKNM